MSDLFPRDLSAKADASAPAGPLDTPADRLVFESPSLSVNDLTELTRMLQEDQRQRWAEGKPLSLEDYREQYPALQVNAAVFLDLLFHELQLRRAAGQTPSLEEYERRFPDLGPLIERRAALEKTLTNEAPGPIGLVRKPRGLQGRTRVDTVVQGERPTVPGYDILEELGRGGMGVVYKARQQSLDRLVALKMIGARGQTDPTNLVRFKAEAEAIAQLRHANIVQIYEVGEHNGQPYFSLEFIEGGTLADKLSERPLPPEQAATLLEALARAVHSAHQQGIIHRDLKPANVMLTADGEPKIADFGLAKRVNVAGGRTRAGAVMGTPSYMAPEQAAGRTEEIGAPADIYSLGAILYECLTGRPPFLAASPVDTMLQVVNADPVPPMQLQPKVPADLQTICLKCLAKAPAQRYASAQELADDLKRFLAGEPIQARPVGLVERCIKWGKRRPEVATLLALVVLAVFLLIGSGIRYHLEVQDALTHAREHERLANEARDAAAREVIRLKILTGDQLVDAGHILGALPWFVDTLADDAIEPQRAMLDRVRLGVLLRQCPHLANLWFHEGRVTWATFNPDGCLVLTTSTDRTACVWDVATGKRVCGPLVHANVVNQGRFDRDGRRVVTSCDDGQARVWSVPDGKLLATLSHPRPVQRAEFNAAGDRLVTCSSDNKARVWDVARGELAVPELTHHGRVRSAVFSPDGSLVLTASADRTARLWDATTGTSLVPPLTHQEPLYGATFSPDGQKVVTASADRTARLWDVSTGKPLSPPLPHQGAVVFASFSPDGDLLATCCTDTTIHLWDTASGFRTARTLKMDSTPHDVQFSPDGKYVAAASDDNTARVWEVATAKAIGPPLDHTSEVYCTAFHPTKPLLLTASADGTARVWIPLDQHQRARTILKQDARVTQAAFHPQRHDLVLTASEAGSCWVWNAQTGEKATPAMKHADAIRHAEFSRDGTRIGTASSDRTARVWHAVTGAPLTPPLAHKEEVLWLTFSPNGRRVATASADDNVRIWDAATGQEQVRFTPPHHGDVYSVQFSPDGQRVVTASADATARIWDVASGKLLRTLHHAEEVYYAEFSPDGRRVVTASSDRSARVWDAATGQPLTPPLQHASRVYWAAFSPGPTLGRWVVTASADSTARVWNAATGEPQTGALAHKGAVWQAHFSHQGLRVLTVSADTTARLWDTLTGGPLTPSLPHHDEVAIACFSSDSTRVMTASDDNLVSIWNMAPDTRPREDLVRMAELLAGGRIGRSGVFEPLEPKTLQAIWQQMCIRHPEQFGPRP